MNQIPSSIETEKLILGLMLLDQDLVDDIVDKLVVGDFYNPLNRKIFLSIQTLSRTGSEINVVSLLESLKSNSDELQFGGVAYLTGLTHGLPIIRDYSQYINLLKEKSFARNLYRASASLADTALSGEMTSEELIQHAETSILSLAPNEHQANFSHVQTIVQESIELSHLRAQSGDAIVGLETGYTDLDVKLQGLKNGDLIVLAARPAVGKSVLAMNIAQFSSFHRDKLVAFFSLEMSEEQLAVRIVASEARVEGYRYTLGHLSDEEWQRVNEVNENLANKQLFIDHNSSPNPAIIKSKIRRLERQEGRPIDLIIVDYLQLMGGDNKQFRQAEIAELSRSMKLIAREFDCPVILLSQLNRESEKRSNHRPTLADLRESGAIEQDADIVVFIYREDLFIGDPSLHTNIAEVIVAKNRQGGVGTSRLRFDGPLFTFRNLAQEATDLTGDF